MGKTAQGIDLTMMAEHLLPMRQALVPLVGVTGYRRLLAALFNAAFLHAAGAPAKFVEQLEDVLGTTDIEAIPRHEAMLEHDSKSRIYVVQITLADAPTWTWTLKWYNGARQLQAPIEEQMSAFFRQRLAPSRAVVPIVAVVQLSDAVATGLSVALLPYAGDVTLYDRLHQLPRHAPEVKALLQQASETLAYTQVLGRVGHEEGTMRLTHLSAAAAPAYFLDQVKSALLQPFAASGDTLAIGEALLKQFVFFARILGDDSSSAGLYYRGMNPRNVILVGDRQAEIDFEQDSLRSRFIDIVSLLENGLEMTTWDDTADYPAYAGQIAFAAWTRQRHRAQAALAQYNYVSQAQIESLTTAFIATTLRLEQQLQGTYASYHPVQYRLVLESARLFRHLQYVGYCKRNELQTTTPSKRMSSRYRQRFHALWAKVALDNLLFPAETVASVARPGLPEPQWQTAMALRHTLDQLLLGLLDLA